MPTIKKPAAKPATAAPDPKPPKLSKAAAARKIQEADAKLQAAAPKGQGGMTYREQMTAILSGGLHILSGTTEDGQLNLIQFPPDLDLRITGEMARKILGWETEDQYAARMLAIKPDAQAEQCTFQDSLEMPPSFKFGINPKTAVRVVCWNNDRNRAIDLKRCEEFAQTILTRQWAGPSTMESINGESGVIGNTGQPLSCQHCLVGLLMAIDIWQEQDSKWREFWPEEPYIEKLIILGVSESARVVQTLDNVRPRSLEDELYVGDEFRDLIPSQRREVARMASKAIDLLWKRTAAELTTTDGTKRTADGGRVAFLTHATAREFLSRHDRLKKTVRLIFDLNKQRALSILGLSAGQCAAMFYLMGCSTSDMYSYRNPRKGLPTEKSLDWDRWEEAWKFWVRLASNDAAEAEPLRRVLRGFSVTEDEGMSEGDGGPTVRPTVNVHGGNLLEKTCVLAMAWQHVCEGSWPTEEDLALNIHQYEDGSRAIVNRDDFGGIDSCHVPLPDLEEKKTPAQIAAEKEAIKAEAAEKARAEAAAKAQAKIDALRAKGKVAQLDQLAAQAAANAGKAPNGKPLTRKQVNEQQTANAKQADAIAQADVKRAEAKAAQKAKAAAPVQPEPEEEADPDVTEYDDSAEVEEGEEAEQEA